MSHALPLSPPRHSQYPRPHHSKFGQGKVQSVEGEGEKATAVVYFGSDVGNKKLKLKFAKLRVIG